MSKVVSMKQSPIISKHSFVGYKPKWTTSKKSLTIPNRTLTLREIADRFANGLSIIDEKVALYDDGVTIIKGFENSTLLNAWKSLNKPKALFVNFNTKRR